MQLVPVAAPQTEPKRVRILDDVSERTCDLLIVAVLILIFLVITAAYFVVDLRFDYKVTGNTGAPGPKGPTGGTGAIGNAGDVGPSGVLGPTGRTGEAGDSGIIGLRGPTGWNCWDTDETGASGVVLQCFGAIGPTGPDGPIGPIGPTGVTGLAGGVRCWDRLYTGTCVSGNDANGDGVCNITDCAGAICNSAYNLTQCRGHTGPIGPLGPTGLTGPTGATGNVTGPTGSRGCECWNLGCLSALSPTDIIVYNVNTNPPIGLNSFDCVGPTGDAGLPGDQGTIGPKGQTGDTGPAGMDGINGTNATGLVGATGPNGTSCWTSIGGGGATNVTSCGPTDPVTTAYTVTTAVSYTSAIAFTGLSNQYTVTWYSSNFYSIAFSIVTANTNPSGVANQYKHAWLGCTPGLPSSSSNCAAPGGYANNRAIVMNTTAGWNINTFSTCYSSWQAIIPGLPATPKWNTTNAVWSCTLQIQPQAAAAGVIYTFNTFVDPASPGGSNQVPCNWNLRYIAAARAHASARLNDFYTWSLGKFIFTCIGFVSL